jgi:hypothetical protein
MRESIFKTLLGPLQVITGYSQPLARLFFSPRSAPDACQNVLGSYRFIDEIFSLRR